MKPRIEKTFWEKLGFKDKKKEDQNMKDAKDKTDKVYRQLKDTINKSIDSKNKLEDCRNLIKFQEKKTEDLKVSLEVHKETLLRNDDYIEAALNEHTRRRDIN